MVCSNYIINTESRVKKKYKFYFYFLMLGQRHTGKTKKPKADSGEDVYLPHWSAAPLPRPRLHTRCWVWRRSACASGWVKELDWNCPSAGTAEGPQARRSTRRPTPGHTCCDGRVRDLELRDAVLFFQNFCPISLSFITKVMHVIIFSWQIWQDTL